MVVLPAASKPNITTRISLLPKILSKSLRNACPILLLADQSNLLQYGVRPERHEHQRQRETKGTAPEWEQMEEEEETVKKRRGGGGGAAAADAIAKGTGQAGTTP
jgi:hypothetical protein